ncbi:MAG: hypothetical protein JSU06_08025 [Actinobacteria bacterium]|nr:hypothetical protein [Actinomycetota bacterium]
MLVVAAIGAVGLVNGASASGPRHPLTSVIQTSKSCSSGYTRAVLPDGVKCLHDGEFCTKTYQSYYHRYGYTCALGSDGRLRLSVW